MSEINQDRPEISLIIKAILTTTAVVVLPAVAWGMFGWMHILLPLVSFFVLEKFGHYTGLRFILVASVLSLVCYLLAGSIDLFLFSAIFLLAGYVLHTAYARGDSPALSGLKASATMALGWFATLFVFTWGSDVSPYQQLINTLDVGISEALKYYQANEDVSAETMVMLQTTLGQMKAVIPLVMPAVLGGFILLITWLTMIIANSFLLKQNGTTTWTHYGRWQLPDRMIWLPIALGLAVMVPVPLLRIVAINGLILLSIVYCFQGLAVAVFYMNKWSVPILMRSFFYVMMIIQTFGTVILLIFGIADVWLDLRKIRVKAIAKED